MSLAQRRGMVDRERPSLSTARQCALLGVARSSLYYRPREASGENLALMQAMDRQYLDTPFYGSRRMKVWLAREGRPAGEPEAGAGRLMRIMGLRAIYRSPRASRPAPEHRVYPYLLRNDQGYPAQPDVGRRHHLPAHGPGIPLLGGRHGLAQPVRGGLAIVQHPGGRLLRRRLEGGAGARPAGGLQHRPEPAPAKAGGSQFTSLEFTQALQEHGVKISMDGKGRYTDNIFVERLWRTLKYEEVYLKAYANASEARRELGAYFRFYNDQRPHQALGYRTPAEVFHEARNATVDRSKLTEGPPERVLASLAGAAGLSLNSTSDLSN